MQTPPAAPHEFDRFFPSGGSNGSTSTRPYRLRSHRPSTASRFSFGPGSANPHDLIADLSSSRLQVIANESGDVEQPGSPFPGTPVRNGLNRDHAVLLNMAAEQGNSGLLSVSPILLGPPLPFPSASPSGSMSSFRNLKRARYSEASSGMSSNDSPIPAFKGALFTGRLRDRKGSGERNSERGGHLLRLATERNMGRIGAGADRSFAPENTPSSMKSAPVAAVSPLPERSFNNADGMDVSAIDELFGEAGVLPDDEEEEEDVDPSWSMIARMRTWRHDAIHQHLYETAAFWGDKIFTWTGEPNDAFWLAQAHFLMGHYLRAEKILTGPLPPSQMPRLSQDSQVEEAEKGKDRVSMRGMADFSMNMPRRSSEEDIDEDEDGEEDQSWIGDLMKNTNGGLWGALTSVNDREKGARRMFSKKEKGAALTEWSMPCKYLAALCMVHQERFTDALQLIGESNPFASTGLNGAKIRSEAGDLKMEASLCRLRGVLYLRLNSLVMAKECYMEALSLDVRNYDVFNELINEMMLPEEEWDFIQSLSYRDQLAEEDATFVKLVYTSRLNKTIYSKQITAARRRLATEYNLGTNSDIWVAAAEDLFSKYKFEECYLITSRIITKEPGHATGLPLHLACLAQIPRLASSLFMLAHKLVEQEPASPLSWYAVGLWYYVGGRYAEARRYFAATHDEDTRFAPAWIAFAHCFAFEKEHEQAITAYSTTARLFPGSYFPHVCIGMEYLHLNNLDRARESFDLAHQMNSSDPLLLNELGVCHYNKGDYESAIFHYEAAIRKSKRMQGVTSEWAVTYNNLGHAYRRLDKPEEAIKAYQNAIKLNALNISALTSLGMLAHEAEDIKTAVERYHQALAIETTNPIATFLLERALKEQIEFGSHQFEGLPAALTDPDLDPFRSSDLHGNPMAQNRLLQLPPFPNFAELEANEEEEPDAEEQPGSDVEETTLDEVEEGEEEEGDEEAEAEGDGTAMSMSMEESVEEDERGTIHGDGSTMDLE